MDSIRISCSKIRIPKMTREPVSLNFSVIGSASSRVRAPQFRRDADVPAYRKTRGRCQKTTISCEIPT